jgi:hypothetical protein
MTTNEIIQEIITKANKLDWIQSRRVGESYPSMQLSEVEKCIAAVLDPKEMVRIDKWIAEKEGA